jgi:hypothetical protein
MRFQLSNALAERNKGKWSQTSLPAFRTTLPRGFLRRGIPTGKQTFQPQAHPADVDHHPPNEEAAGFQSSCDHLPNSETSDAPDMNGESPFPKKRFPTIRTGFVVYLFIPQEITTGSSTSSSEPRTNAPTISEEAIVAKVQAR